MPETKEAKRTIEQVLSELDNLEQRRQELLNELRQHRQQLDKYLNGPDQARQTRKYRKQGKEKAD